MSARRRGRRPGPLRSRGALGVLVPLAGLALLVTTQLEASQEPAPSGPVVGDGFSFLRLWAQNPIISASSVPEAVRFVPTHAGDVVPTFPGPIADPSIAMPWIHFGVAVSAELGYAIGRSQVNVEATSEFTTPITTDGFRNSRNYTNDVGTENRGYGAALTYYRLSYGDSGFPIFTFGRETYIGVLWSFRPDTVPRVLRDPDGTELFVSYGQRFSKIFIETGWDRYERYEVFERYLLTRVTSHVVTLGAMLPGPPRGKLFLSVSLPRRRGSTALGPDSGLELTPSASAGFSGWFFKRFRP